jgi:hypothetical protein
MSRISSRLRLLYEPRRTGAGELKPEEIDP